MNDTYTLKEVVLLKPHRHLGKDLPPGAAVALAAQIADWLISLGTAKLASPKTPPKSPTTSGVDNVPA